VKTSSQQIHHDPYAALRLPEFRNLVLATFLLTFALLMQEVAIGYELYRLTHDPLALGMIGLIEAIPFITFSLFGGHIADRYSKRKILQLSVACIGSASFLLQLIERQSAMLSQNTMIAAIYATIFFIGLARAFQSPTASSLRAILVPVHLYENASTWGSNAWQTGAIVGPAVAGFVYAWAGFSNALLCVSLMVWMAFFLYSRIGDRPVENIKKEETLVASIKQGIGFVFKKKIILYSISLDLFSVLFGGVMALLPIYAQDILFVGPEGLGILRAAPSLGAVLMLFMLTRVSAMNHAWRNLLYAVTGFGICILIFAVSRSMLLSVIALFFSGTFDSVSVVIRATILQTMTPNELRGRVQSVNGIFLASSNEVGAFESGAAAKLLGTVPSAIFGGVMTMLIVGFVSLRTRDLLNTKIKSA
jgi:MFS family permease